MKAMGSELIALFGDSEQWTEYWGWTSNDRSWDPSKLVAERQYEVENLGIYIHYEGNGTRPHHPVFYYDGSGPWDGCALSDALKRWRRVAKVTALTVIVPKAEMAEAQALFKERGWRTT